MKVLVEAGAELGTRDKAHQSTPLGWAEYGAKGENERAKRYVEILQQFGARASLALFPNAGHEVTGPMQAQAIEFLAAVGS